MRCLAYFFILTFSLTVSFAQTPLPRPKYISLKANNHIIIDGTIDNTWDHHLWSDNWGDLVTGESGLYRTRFKSSWNQQYLYFFIEVINPDIKASIDTNHAPLFKYDNTIELFLDPDGDQLNYYELQINAFGARWELSLDKPYNKGGVSTSPDELKGLRYNISINGSINDSDDMDKNWILEIGIPWASLRKYGVESIPPQKEFRFNLSRVYHDVTAVKTPAQYWVWAPVGVFNIHIPEKWGVLTFGERSDH